MDEYYIYIYIYIYITNIKYNLTRWFQTIYIYENLLAVAYFSINGRFCVVSWENPTFSNVSTCQTRSYDFWIMNALCTFMYLFVEYFSFAPVISGSIHRYVHYFDIQVLMMVTETETLTSTLHHNKFTYLDYVLFIVFFSCCLHTVGF